MKERKKEADYTFLTNAYKHDTEFNNLHTLADLKLRTKIEVFFFSSWHESS